MGNYWPTMERDCMEYVKKCVKCQQHVNLCNQPLHTLQPMQPLWPFSRWKLDLIIQISPIFLGGHKFIITSIEYFTKWVEEIPMISTKGPKIVEFIQNHIICHYGILAQIITNNGKKNSKK